MLRGGKACKGEVILQGVEDANQYEYSLVTWRGQPRIGFRWIGRGRLPRVTLDAALYPAIIANILPQARQQRARDWLGPVLAAGNYPPNSMLGNPNQNYLCPQHVLSPKNHLGLFNVVLNKGPGDCAYMIGQFYGYPNAVGFRWNGNNIHPGGCPLSRGQWPAWVMLEPNLHNAVRQLLVSR